MRKLGQKTSHTTPIKHVFMPQQKVKKRSQAKRAVKLPLPKIKGLPLMILLAFVVGLISLAIVKAPFLQVSKVEVFGLEQDNAIKHDADQLRGKNILLLNVKKIQANFIQKYPAYAHITIHKSYPNALTIVVEPNVPVALLLKMKIEEIEASPTATPITTDVAQASQSAMMTSTLSASLAAQRKRIVENTYYVNRKGIPYSLTQWNGTLPSTSSAKSKQTQSNVQQLMLPIILFSKKQDITIGNPLQDEYISQAIRILELLEAKSYTVQSVDEYQPNGIIMTIVEVPKVVFAVKGDPNSQVIALQTILQSTKIERKKISQLDLRFANPIVTYK